MNKEDHKTEDSAPSEDSTSENESEKGVEEMVEEMLKEVDIQSTFQDVPGLIESAFSDLNSRLASTTISGLSEITQEYITSMFDEVAGYVNSEAEKIKKANLPKEVKYVFETFQVDAKDVTDGDSFTVYVNASDPNLSALYEDKDVGEHLKAEVELAKAKVDEAWTKRAEALEKKLPQEAALQSRTIASHGYKIQKIHGQEVIGMPLRIRLRVKGDGIEKKEENRTFELHCESGTCISPNRDAHLTWEILNQMKQRMVEEKKSIEFFEESIVFTVLFWRREGHELFGYSSGQNKVREGEVKKAAQFYEEGGIDNIEKSGFFRDNCCMETLNKRKQKKKKSEEENKAVELQVDCDIFAGAEKHLLFETDETKGDNIIAKSLEMSVGPGVSFNVQKRILGDVQMAELLLHSMASKHQLP